MVRTDFHDVAAMHRKYGFPPWDQTPMFDKPQPKAIPQKWMQFRIQFLIEEQIEFIHAIDDRDLVQATDALVDLAYVAYGTALFAGITPWNQREWPTFEKSRDLLRELLGPAHPETIVPQLPHHTLSDGLLFALEGEVKALRSANWFSPPPTSRAHLQWAHVFSRRLWRILDEVYSVASLMGIPWAQCWSIVHESNMQKIKADPDGSNSKRGVGVDLVKPPGWIPPTERIHHLLKSHGATGI